MSKSVNVDFVTRQIEVDTDGKEYYVSAAVAAKDAEQSMLNAQNAANVAEAAKNSIAYNLNEKGYATYPNVNVMKNANLVAGQVVRTAGYYNVNDGGGGWYYITESGVANNMDVIACGNVYANLIIENGIANIRQFGAKGDFDDGDQAIINRVVWDDKIGCVLFPKGFWKAYVSNGVSNRTFIFEEGAIIDGVVHIATGDGPEITAGKTDIDWVENVRCIGCITSTIRVGTYYCKNVNIDKIHLLANNSNYPNQTSEGGQKGIHWYFGSKNVNVGDVVVDDSMSIYGFGIDMNTIDDDDHSIENITIGKMTVFSRYVAAFVFKNIKGLNIGEIDIPIQKLCSQILNCENVKIGKITIHDTTSDDSMSITNSSNISIGKIFMPSVKSIALSLTDVNNMHINEITIRGNAGFYGLTFADNVHDVIVDMLESSHLQQGIRWINSSRIFGKYWQVHDCGLGMAFDGIAIDFHLDYVRWENNTSNSNQEISATVVA